MNRWRWWLLGTALALIAAGAVGWLRHGDRSPGIARSLRTCGSPSDSFTVRASLGLGRQINAPLFRAALSANGRYVAFATESTGLVRHDLNRHSDVFVRDLQTRFTSRVSVSTTGGQANGASAFPSISRDGRYVAFRSWAKNLVPRDTNRAEDIFVRDMVTGTTRRVSVASDGREANASSVSSNISANGRYVAFTSRATNLYASDRNGVADVFVRDLSAHRTQLVSIGMNGPANGLSEESSISANGRIIGFRSFATNLVPGDTNGLPDDFVRDRLTGQTERENVSSTGKQSFGVSFRVTMSGDGRYTAFRSRGRNLVPHDTNNALDVFEHDRFTGATTRVSVTSAGEQVFPSDSSLALRRVQFMSRAMLSETGRYVVFGSRAEHLVPGDTNGQPDVFVHDRKTGTTTRVSLAADGEQADGASHVVGISGDGRVIAFISSATNLVPGDTNGLADLFVRAPCTP